MKIFFTVSLILLGLVSLAQNPTRLVNDHFAVRPFGFELTESNLKRIGDFRQVQKRPVANTHHAGVIDTIVTYKLQNDEIVFLRTSKKSFFTEAIITSNKTILTDGIHVGLSADSVCMKLGLKAKSTISQIIVNDETEYSLHTLVFSQGRLLKVYLKRRID